MQEYLNSRPAQAGSAAQRSYCTTDITPELRGNAVYRVYRWSSAGASQRPVRNVERERSSAMAMTLAKPVNYGAPLACTGIWLDRAKNDTKTSMSPIPIPLCPVKPTRLKTAHELNPPAPASRQAGEIRR